MLVRVNAKNLEYYRNLSELSRYALSIKSGLGKNAISQLESRKYDKCSLVRLKSIAKQLKINVNDLIEEEKI